MTTVGVKGWSNRHQGDASCQLAGVDSLCVGCSVQIAAAELMKAVLSMTVFARLIANFFVQAERSCRPTIGRGDIWKRAWQFNCTRCQTGTPQQYRRDVVKLTAYAAESWTAWRFIIESVTETVQQAVAVVKLAVDEGLYERAASEPEVTVWPDQSELPQLEKKRLRLSDDASWPCSADYPPRSDTTLRNCIAEDSRHSRLGARELVMLLSRGYFKCTTYTRIQYPRTIPMRVPSNYKKA